MDNQNYTTERRKGQHLTDEERYFIQYALKQGMNKNQIAKLLDDTVYNESSHNMYYPILIIVLAAAGLYFTVRTRFVQIRLLCTA